MDKNLELLAKNRLIIVLIAVCAVLFIINHMILNSLKQENSRQKTIIDQNALLKAKNRALEKVPVKQAKKRYKLVPEDPAKYGIVSVAEHSMPQSQMHWDYQMEKVIKDSKVLETKEGQQAVEKMAMSPEKFNETMQRVDKQITHFEELKLKKPFDKSVNKRLQTLYKVKALSKVLKDKVTNVPKEKLKIAESLLE